MARKEVSARFVVDSRDRENEDIKVAQELIPAGVNPSLFTSKDDIVSLGRENIDALITRWKKGKADVFKEKINSLERLREGADSRPLVPQFRKDDHFQKGEKVIFFFNRQGRVVFLSSIVQYVLMGDRTVTLLHKKLLTIDPTWSMDSRMVGKYQSVGIYRPEVMKETEFEYLIRNPVFTALWLHINIPISAKADCQNLFNAFASEASRRDYQKRWIWE